MYMGGPGQVVESTFDSFFNPNHGVRVGLLCDYVPTHKILFRRLPDRFLTDRVDDPFECLRMRWQLVVSAMKHMRKPYGSFSLLRFIKLFPLAINSCRKPSSFACSTLYDAALADAVSRVIGGGDSVTPAKLAGAHEFQTLDIFWAHSEAAGLVRAGEPGLVTSARCCHA